ncbi:MAG: hypothetical protein FJ104_11995, partial [Deltaproteobacteria bacterium]|nr:hypothetical protein [Deltaproteobacteria bacterium]
MRLLGNRLGLSSLALLAAVACAEGMDVDGAGSGDLPDGGAGDAASSAGGAGTGSGGGGSVAGA